MIFLLRGLPSVRSAVFAVGWDSVHDQLTTGRKIRVLTMVDKFTWFSPMIEPRFSFRAADVVEVLERVGRAHGFPNAIRVDQGTASVSRDLDLWAYL